MRLVARIGVDKGDDFRFHGKGQFERKVALAVARHTVENPARNQAQRQADLFKKLDLLRLGGEPDHIGMFEDKIERQKPPHDNRRAGPSPVADVLDAKRPVDRVARYATQFSSSGET